MPNFRKKPVVIEARQYDGTIGSAVDIIQWAGIEDEVTRAGGLIIRTSEGDHFASPGDWIIKGVKGEFYPCKPDIFAATYDPA